MLKKYVIKGGLIGAVVYPVLHVAILFVALCAYFGSNTTCRVAGWLYLHLFTGEILAEIIRPIDAFPLFLAVSISVDLVIGFLIGSIAAALLRSWKSNTTTPKN